MSTIPDGTKPATDITKDSFLCFHFAVNYPFADTARDVMGFWTKAGPWKYEDGSGEAVELLISMGEDHDDEAALEADEVFKGIATLEQAFFSPQPDDNDFIIESAGTTIGRVYVTSSVVETRDEIEELIKSDDHRADVFETQVVTWRELCRGIAALLREYDLDAKSALAERMARSTGNLRDGWPVKPMSGVGKAHSNGFKAPDVSGCRPVGLSGEGNNPTKGDLTGWKPFPIHVLPKLVADYVQAGAQALSCDESMVALPMLAALGSTIGNRAIIEIKPGWTHSSLWWTCIVSMSGTMKSPAIDVSVNLVRQIQENYYKIYNDKVAKLEEDETPPVMKRCLIGDTTIEALTCVLHENQSGLLCHADELSGWTSSFTRYKGKSNSSDVQNWLSIFNGGAISNDRKLNRQHFYIPRSCVSVTGGIQPGILQQQITKGLIESGFAARILWAYPPRRPKVFTDDYISDDLQKAMSLLFHEIAGIEGNINPFTGNYDPYKLKLSFPAKERFKLFVNTWGMEAITEEETMAAAMSKLEAYVVRFALLHHFVDCVTTNNFDSEVPAICIEKGIELVTWARNEATRIYSMLGASEKTSDAMNTLDLLRRIQLRHGHIKARDLQRANSSKYPTAKVARTFLDRWVIEGILRMEAEGIFILAVGSVG